MRLRLVLALVLLAAIPAAARAAEIPIEDFLRLPKYTEMTVSPDGRSLAVLAPRLGRQNLFVLDIAARNARPVTAYDANDVVWYGWISSRRLAVRTGSLAEKNSDRQRSGLLAVDVDGEFGRDLADPSDRSPALRHVFHAQRLVRAMPGETDVAVVQEFTFADKRTQPGNLLRIDTRTGQRTNIGYGKPASGDTESWIVDREGVARALTVQSGDNIGVYYRASADAAWRKLIEYQVDRPGYVPLAVDPADGTLIVRSRAGQDRLAIQRVDPSTGKVVGTLAAHASVDILGLITGRDGTPVGVWFQAEHPGVAWFDERLTRAQRTVDTALPGMTNTITSWSDAMDRYVIESSSDVAPGAFYLLDVKQGKLEWVADRMPWINPRDMSPMQPVRYTARDGLGIPAYLTLPAKGSGKNLPLVVLPHGGPWIRGDTWQFNPEVQFLASRGYAVLQPNFRGTLGYGWKHYSASFGQWGVAMEDDLADGVRWAVDQGIADPKRVCIYGASYGGYAALMGVVRTPDLYRCAVAYLAPTDLHALLTITWSDYAYSDLAEAMNRAHVGDPDKDRERLDAASPALHADRIQVPVLLAYGAQDYRVPLTHGERMKAALDRYGKKYEWIVVSGEGHGFRDPENQKAFYGAVERFLREHLAP